MIGPAIDVIIDGKRHAFVTWTIIPRVGELVMFNDGKIVGKVKQVVWADDTAAPPSMERQWIQLVCESTTLAEEGLSKV